jgi:tRNA(Ile)-lysidine synthase
LHVIAAHVHHGYLSSPGDDADLVEKVALQQSYRDQALEFSRSLCCRWQVDFVSNDGFQDLTVNLNSEDECRRVRYGWLHKWRKELDCGRVLLAHHREDLLETRLIRLIRGCGPDGLEAMAEDQQNLLRLFLFESRLDLEKYLCEQGIRWMEDPSNGEIFALRNWIRREWLPQLELRRPGAVLCMGASLQRLTEALSEAESDREGVQSWTLDGIERSLWLTWSVGQQRRVLARYLHGQGIRDFSQGQIDEVIKRLDSPKEQLSFRVAGLRWRVTRSRIQGFYELLD